MLERNRTTGPPGYSFCATCGRHVFPRRKPRCHRRRLRTAIYIESAGGEGSEPTIYAQLAHLSSALTEDQSRPTTSRNKRLTRQVFGPVKRLDPHLRKVDTPLLEKPSA